MVVEYIRYTIDSDACEAFESAYKMAFKPLLESQYCISAELSQCVEETTSYILRIEWTSADDHMGGFRKSPEFQAFLPLIRPYIQNIQEMRHYSVVCSSSAVQALSN